MLQPVRGVVKRQLLSACRKTICQIAKCTNGGILVRCVTPHRGTPGEGSPPENIPLGRFTPLLRSFEEDISSSEEDGGAFAPQPHRLLKKAGENFLYNIFCEMASLTV